MASLRTGSSEPKSPFPVGEPGCLSNTICYLGQLSVLAKCHLILSNGFSRVHECDRRTDGRCAATFLAIGGIADALLQSSRMLRWNCSDARQERRGIQLRVHYSRMENEIKKTSRVDSRRWISASWRMGAQVCLRSFIDRHFEYHLTSFKFFFKSVISLNTVRCLPFHIILLLFHNGIIIK